MKGLKAVSRHRNAVNQILMMQDDPRWLNFGMHFDFRGGRVNEEKTAEKEMCLSVVGGYLRGKRDSIDDRLNGSFMELCHRFVS